MKVESTVGLTRAPGNGTRRRRGKLRPNGFALRINGKTVKGVSYTAEEARELRAVLTRGSVAGHSLAHNHYRPGKRGIEANMARAGVKITGNHRAKKAA